MCTNENQVATEKMPQRESGAASRWFVYVLECGDGSLYTGSTTDISRRLHEHNFTTRGAKYTRSRRPVKLRYHAALENRSAALREEIRIKRLTRAQKLELISEKA